MATRSSIIMKLDDNVFAGIYCHFDGYIKGGVGEMLMPHYTEREKVMQLIMLGSISCLEREAIVPDDINHSYDNSVEGYTIAYHRDRGEDWEHTAPVTDKSLAKVINKIGNYYNYLFIEGVWYVDTELASEYKGNNKIVISGMEFVPISEVIDNE